MDFDEVETYEENDIWIPCAHCGETGFSGHDCGEDTCCCLDPEENVECFICQGMKGWWVNA